MAANTENVCLTNVRLSSTDVGVGCATSNFLIGFLKDDDWSVGPRRKRWKRWRRFTNEMDLEVVFCAMYIGRVLT